MCAMPIVEKQSHAFDIRESFFGLLAADSFFAGHTARKTRFRPEQTYLIPYLGVYIADELMTPDGDANAGCVRFCHSARIGLSVVEANNDDNAAEAKIDAAFLRIMTVLWTDVHLMNVLKNSNVEGVGIESITRGTRRHIFGASGANNEYPWVAMEYDVTAFYRTEWYPDITDTLNEIDVTVKVNNLNGNVQPVNIKYMFTALRAARIDQ
jgi:hypothetical protein